MATDETKDKGPTQWEEVSEGDGDCDGVRDETTWTREREREGDMLDVCAVPGHVN